MPGTNDRFLIKSQGWHWSEITASSLVPVDRDGKLNEGEAAPEPTPFYIHWRIHRGAPHARAVLHTHMPYATAITTVGDGRLESISQTVLGFFDRIAYDDTYNGLAFDGEEGDRMTRALGNKSVLFLANHGVIVTGRDMHCAFDDLYYLERASQLQWLAMSTGRPLRRMADDVVQRTARQFAKQDDSQSGRNSGRSSGFSTMRSRIIGTRAISAFFQKLGFRPTGKDGTRVGRKLLVLEAE